MRDLMLIVHFIGLTMGLGTSFAHAFLASTFSKLASSEASKLQLQVGNLSKMGATGTILLLVSGIYLLIPYLPSLAVMPFLILKLVLFLVLIVLILLINREAKLNAQRESSLPSKRAGILGKLALIVGVLIVILAVNIFH